MSNEVKVYIERKRKYLHVICDNAFNTGWFVQHLGRDRPLIFKDWVLYFYDDMDEYDGEVSRDRELVVCGPYSSYILLKAIDNPPIRSCCK